MRTRLAPDSGIGMILVIGVTLLVATLTATAGVVVMNGLSQSRIRVTFEQALATAESGIDYALGNLQRAYDRGPRDFPIPRSGVAPVAGCTLNPETLPDWSGVADPAAAEKAWVASWFDQKLATPLGRQCLINTPTGQVMVLKPANPVGSTPQYGRVYARGFSPSFGHAQARQRTIKVEYVFLPYKPQHAILTGTKLMLQSTSTDVTGVDSEAARLAAVHTNGTLETVGSPTVTGEVSSSIDSSSQVSSNFLMNPGGVPAVRKVVPIPHISAAQFYSQAPTQDAEAVTSQTVPWVDLCDDGTARERPDADQVPDPEAEEAVEPCTGEVLAQDTTYRGWSWDEDRHAWVASQDTLSGTYFVHHADVYNGTGNGSISNITVIASATSTDCSTKRYGNIVWDHYNTLAPAFKNLFFLADGDLAVTSNLYSGSSGDGQVPISGMYVAAEEILVWTSSSGLVGSVLAANQCPTEGSTADDTGPVSVNEVQGQIIKFDPNGDSPFSSLISTTLWLEY